MSQDKIILEKLKGVNNLEFNIPNSGVHIMTAKNGGGKTTLITCLQRLRDTRAFNNNFKKNNAWNVDSFEDSKITYQTKTGVQTTYTYREKSDSWRATTRGVNAIDLIDYDEITIIHALDQTRVYIQPQKIGGGKNQKASEEFRNKMASILEDERFKLLRKTNLGEIRGRGGRARRKNTAFMLPTGKKIKKYGKTSNGYYSEANFSLGEIFTLNLLYELKVIKDNSLIVIDELEVALHPRVQINLLDFLTKIADEKNLTVLISTHSSSLIKCAPNIIFFEKDTSGNIKVNYNCYPALALQEVAVNEDYQPDFVFFVEDEFATALMKETIIKYFQIENSKQKPLWKVLPIGGYYEVLKFAQNSNQYLLSNRIGQFIFLDNDVKSTFDDLNSKGNSRTTNEQKLWSLFKSQIGKLQYLEVTPELGLMNWMRNDPSKSSRSINELFPDSIIDVVRILRECEDAFPTEASNERTEAKNKMRWMIPKLVEITNESETRIIQRLTTAYVDDYYSKKANQNKLKQQFGPIFRK